MKTLEKQTAYWDSISGKKRFSHPVPIKELKGLLAPYDRILDFGCGYGRACTELAAAGFKRICGVDISEKMVNEGLLADPSLDLLVFYGNTLPFADESFSACLFLAVLNCIPEESGQKQAVSEILRVLKPGGILYLSDYPIQEDSRNQERYLQCRDELKIFGVFRVDGGGVFRHHEMPWIYSLLSEFELQAETYTEVLTMNGNPARIFQILARKKNH